MARKRLQQSTADYLAIAISPVLIMLLVGSLVFFLQEISYHGQFQGRVRWMLGWFVFATVLISRIGIEFGKAHASIYAGALALACAAFAFRFLEEYLVGTIVLMGVIWWCVNQLTWDCTVIDDSVEVSSGGLLQQSGMDDSGSEEEDDDEPVESAKQRRRRLRREKLGLIEQSTGPDASPTSEPEAPQKKPRASGVWVVYFSLAALPLFGVGQAFLPAEDDSVREGFLFLWIYVASALGLFLTTSFLGLRRYLRQRRIKMPTSIAAAWVSSGVVIMLVVLGMCLLIPRPHAGTSVTALLDKFSDDQSASDYAMSSHDAGQGEGRRTGKVEESSDDPGDKMSEKGKPTDTEGEGQKSGQSDQKGKSKGGEESDKNENQDEQTAENESDKDQAQQQAQNSEEESDQRQAGNQGGSQKNDTNNSSKSSRWKMPQMGSTLKWVIYILFGGLIVYVLWKNRFDLAAGAREFWDSILNFWANLFGGTAKKKKRVQEEEFAETPSGASGKTFADYDNPFTTGLAHSMSPDALILYSEEAFRAFARELGIEAGEDVTPQEIGQQVIAKFPEMAEAIRFLTAAHSRILYSSRPPLSFEISPLEPLWTGMTRRETQSVG